MDFGKLPIHELSKVDFTLQADNAFNTKVLSGIPVKKPKVKVGCPEWANKDWNGKIYPHKVNKGDYLRLYSKQFETIELNITHYKIPNQDEVKAWKEDSAEGFTFNPKFPQVITHDNLLQKSDAVTKVFCERIFELEEKLGIPFLQLAPYFMPKHFHILEKYLKTLPTNLKIAVEFRHEDWFKNEKIWQQALSLLQSFGHGTVITDVSGRRDVAHQSLSNSIAMIRWTGNEHPSDYPRIDEWIQKLKSWFEKGVEEVYVFVHVNDKDCVPELAYYWIQQFNLHFDLNLKEPKFLPKVEQMSLF